jgi:hypothetical protein
LVSFQVRTKHLSSRGNPILQKLIIKAYKSHMKGIIAETLCFHGITRINFELVLCILTLCQHLLFIFIYLADKSKVVLRIFPIRSATNLSDLIRYFKMDFMNFFIKFLIKSDQIRKIRNTNQKGLFKRFFFKNLSLSIEIT